MTNDLKKYDIFVDARQQHGSRAKILFGFQFDSDSLIKHWNRVYKSYMR
jgi:hypothetical protein